MKQIGKSLLVALLIILIALLGLLVYANYSEHVLELKRQEALESPDAPSRPSPAADKGFEEPENAANVSLLFCGDIVCHTGLNFEALEADGTYDYADIFGGAVDLVKAADYAACTMETTFAETAEYTGYPRFKSPTDLASSLKRTGFDLINTASNHCVDGDEAGIYRTLDVLDTNGLDHVGTYRSQGERDKNSGILVREINGVSFAILSFTYGTNAIPVTGFEYAVNLMYTDYLDTLTNIDYDRLSADMEKARALDTDVILVMLHWGNEYQLEPNSYQKELSDFFFAEGADIIIGGHTHCPEPMELRIIEDEDGTQRAGFIVYSLGNFVSCQDDPYTNLTAALDIDVQKNLETGETYLRHVSYRPMYMVDLLDFGASSDWRYKLWDLTGAIESYESGNLGVANDALYQDMKTGLDRLHSVFGEKFDIANGGVDVTEWFEENR
ncbi:MAG: CapA family protein [Clostridiales bacterium]|nr:CapA family protein [Clostridiales bacterium]